VTVRAKNNTPAFRAAQRPRPAPSYTQPEQRDRRRNGLSVTLRGGWSLSQEVAAICEPLAQRVAASPHPEAYWRAVDEIADAVHGLVHTAVGLLAERDARRRTTHLSVDQRGRSIRALVDLAERPKLPDITNEALATGTWATTLVDLAEPYSGELAGLLGNALTTAVSDRVLAALREVDHAALALERRLDRDARSREPQSPTPTEADLARAELETLGVTL
jgi:hypothetical protein